MLHIDKAIFDTSDVICKNISKFDDSERGLLSQNILAHLRNLVEYIAEKIYSNGKEINPNSFECKKKAMSYIGGVNNTRFLKQFHELLQRSVSHYTLDENSSERLMLKYYEYLLKMKIYMKDNYGIDILHNIEEFPLNADPELSVYYEKIAEKIVSHYPNDSMKNFSDRYYIQKIKPFFAKERIFYEVTFTAAKDNMSKFDRLIAFTDKEIMSNYAVNLSISNDTIDIINSEMTINIITGWKVSIRPCEFNNFAKILGISMNINVKMREYQELMQFLTESQIPLSDFIESSKEYYSSVRKRIETRSSYHLIFKALDYCREIVLYQNPGANVIKYLLYNMNNRIIKQQYSSDECRILSDLKLRYGCKPFDNMPFCTSLISHNPTIYELLNCFSEENRLSELLARYIQNNTEKEGKLFTPIEELSDFTNIDKLMDLYNSKLYLPKHERRKLIAFHNNIYIKGYADDSAEIIKKLCELTENGIDKYTLSVDKWLKDSSYNIDCDEKLKALRIMFSTSRVALIYGPAGTGKSTMINHISNYFYDKKKVYLAQTHSAVDNMRRKISSGNGIFKTISSFTNDSNRDTVCDVLIIDECSTVSNLDMRKVLEKVRFKILILVGDVYQIESIRFGNWFDIVRFFISQDSIFELRNPYRAKNENLIAVWKAVRDKELAILEHLVGNGYSCCLDESIFNNQGNDEIVLCLSYDGLYGINNINRYLQNRNSNPAIQWGIGVYKVGDPILFSEIQRFSPLIHNNSKGHIVGIKTEYNKIWFEIELDCFIDVSEISEYDFELIGLSDNGNSIIRFSVDKYGSTDEDDNNYMAIVPFQVAYAISIHKAQGLEYDSVKIIITNEIEERITHNVFYTAITRAKDKLRIYWSPETEKSILQRLTIKNSSRDGNLLRQLYFK